MTTAELAERLHREGCSLVVECRGEVRSFTERGVADLLRLVDHEPEALRGARVADKVVGKGAAALMLAGGVAELHADVLSQPALELLHGSDVRLSYGTLTPGIRNRRGDGPCPVESLCADCTTAEECLPRIRQFTSEQLGIRKEELGIARAAQPNS